MYYSLFGYFHSLLTVPSMDLERTSSESSLTCGGQDAFRGLGFASMVADYFQAGLYDLTASIESLSFSLSISLCISIYASIDIRLCIGPYIYIYIHTCMYAYAYVYMHVYIHICVCVCPHMYVCVRTCT